MNARLVTLLTGVLILVSTGAVEGQEPTRTPSSRGWLGVQLVSTPEGRGEPAVYVAAVAPDSPAQAAGLRVGDRILELGEEPASPEAVARLTATLEPGTQVRMVVARDGTRRPVRLTAGRRPVLTFDVAPPRAPSPVPDPAPSVLTLQRDTLRVWADSLRVWMERRPDLPLPPDSVVRGLQARQEAERRRVRVLQFRQEALQRHHDSLQRHHDSLQRHHDSLRGRMGTVRGRLRDLEFFGSTPTAISRLTLGQRMVAGAEFTPLNPSLGSYFGVERGLLTLEVLEGTPADGAGLRPGDVVVAVADEPVGELGEFRSALERAYRTPPVELSIVRERGRRTILLDR